MECPAAAAHCKEARGGISHCSIICTACHTCRHVVAFRLPAQVLLQCTAPVPDNQQCGTRNAPPLFGPLGCSLSVRYPSKFFFQILPRSPLTRKKCSNFVWRNISYPELLVCCQTYLCKHVISLFCLSVSCVPCVPVPSFLLC